MIGALVPCQLADHFGLAATCSGRSRSELIQSLIEVHLAGLEAPAEMMKRYAKEMFDQHDYWHGYVKLHGRKASSGREYCRTIKRSLQRRHVADEYVVAIVDEFMRLVGE